MRHLPLVLRDDEVLAVYRGFKTQHRTIMTPQPNVTESESLYWQGRLMGNPGDYQAAKELIAAKCPHGVKGETLYVRENYGDIHTLTHPVTIFRASDYEQQCRDHQLTSAPPISSIKWRPASSMPKHLSRATLQITATFIEPLARTSEADMVAEGYPGPGKWRPKKLTPAMLEQRYPDGHTDLLRWFKEMWNDKNPHHQWTAKSNPWVWVRKFRVLSANFNQFAG